MRPTLLALLLTLPLLHCASADFTVADQALTTSDAGETDGADAPEATATETEAPPTDSGAPGDASELDTAPTPDTAVPPPDAAGPDTTPAADTAPAADATPADTAAPPPDTAPGPEAGVPCTHCLGQTGICPSATLDNWCWDSICTKRSTCYFTTANVCHCG